MPNEAFEMLSVNSDSMTRPGTMKAPYDTPLTSLIRPPIAAPNTTTKSAVVMTGVSTLCNSVRRKRAISKR